MPAAHGRSGAAALAGALIGLVCLLGTPPAVAQYEGLVDARDPGLIAALAQQYGSAEVTKDEEGAPLIRGEVAKLPYQIEFYGCQDGGECSDVKFHAQWDEAELTLEQINAWHQEFRFGTVHRAEDGTIVLEMSIPVEYGVSRQNFLRVLLRWFQTMALFNRHLEDLGAG